MKIETKIYISIGIVSYILTIYAVYDLGYSKGALAETIKYIEIQKKRDQNILNHRYTK